MKKFSVLILVLLVFSSLWGISAMATQLRGQPLGSVENVVAAIGVDPALKKDSLLYVTHDKSSGKLAFKYARFGDDYNLTTKDNTEQTSLKDYKLISLYSAVSKNYTTSTSTVPPAIVLSTYLTENNLYQVSNPIITANESGGGCNERINRVNFLKYYHR